MVQISSLNKKELKAVDTYIDALGLLSELKGKSWDRVIKRLLMLRILEEEELIELCNQLERINKQP